MGNGPNPRIVIDLVVSVEGMESWCCRGIGFLSGRVQYPDCNGEVSSSTLSVNMPHCIEEVEGFLGLENENTLVAGKPWTKKRDVEMMVGLSMMKTEKSRPNPLDTGVKTIGIVEVVRTGSLREDVRKRSKGYGG